MSKEPIIKAIYPNLVDIGIMNGKPVFIFRNGVDLKIAHEVNNNDNIYIPPPIEKIPWLLPRADEVLKRYNNGIDETLFDDLVKYHKSISDLPDETYYTLLAAWDMHTYLTECALHSPMVHFFAVPERGKSRTGKGMIYIAYRGVAVESLRDAYIVRMAQNFNASIFFDVMDIWKKAEKNNAEDILLHRYEKGARVPRVIHPERGPFKDTEYFSVFGPTIIASNVASNYILESRGILIPMLESNKSFCNDPSPEYALELKERLTAHRGRVCGQNLLNVDKPAKGRLGDILKPIYQIIRMFAPHRINEFNALISIVRERKAIDKATSVEASIILMIRCLENKVARGILPIKTITDEYNAGKNERYHLTYQRVGRITDSLGFEKKTTATGASAILYNKELVEKLLESYSIDKTSEMSELSET